MRDNLYLLDYNYDLYTGRLPLDPGFDTNFESHLLESIGIKRCCGCGGGGEGWISMMQA